MYIYIRVYICICIHICIHVWFLFVVIVLYHHYSESVHELLRFNRLNQQDLVMKGELELVSEVVTLLGQRRFGRFVDLFFAMKIETNQPKSNFLGLSASKSLSG